MDDLIQVNRDVKIVPSPTLCRGCLTPDRDTLSLSYATYKNLFEELTNISLADNANWPRLCWECMSLLQKCIQFRRKLIQSHKLLQQFANAQFTQHSFTADLSIYASPSLSKSNTFNLSYADTEVHNSIVHNNRSSYEKYEKDNNKNEIVESDDDRDFDIDFEVPPVKKETQYQDLHNIIKKETYNEDFAYCIEEEVDVKKKKRSRNRSREIKEFKNEAEVDAIEVIDDRMAQEGQAETSHKRRRLFRVNSSSFEEAVTEFMSEEDSDFSAFDEDQIDPNLMLHVDDDSQSEQSDSDIGVLLNPSHPEPDPLGISLSPAATGTARMGTDGVKYFYGKNGFKWSTSEQIPQSYRTTSHNIIRVPENQRGAKFESLELLWLQLISDDMIDEIVSFTNEKMEKYCSKFKNANRIELRPTTLTEMKALFGLLYYTALFKSNHENADSILATDGTGREIFRCVMSKCRFLPLIKCLRFDNQSTRQERLKTDPLAAISGIFQKFIRNCQQVYTICTNVCIDEMLISFRGKCKFKMYMPNKLAKYGIKVLILCDARTNYVYNAYIYYGEGSHGVGLTETHKKLAVPTKSVICLCKDIEQSNRNVTAGKWFSSIQLMRKLKERGLTYLGELRGNERGIPSEFRASKERTPGSTLFGFTEEYTMVSYVPDMNKAVILISSMHHDNSFDQDNDKPMIITDYNNTKGAVDEIDRKIANHSCSRRTHRWPMAIFYRILDLSVINAFVLYKSCQNSPDITRGIFLKGLARDLILPLLKERVYNEKLPRELRMTVKRVLGKDLPPVPPAVAVLPAATRNTCVICPSRLKRRTQFHCVDCQKPICLGCSKKICLDCTAE